MLYYKIYSLIGTNSISRTTLSEINLRSVKSLFSVLVGFYIFLLSNLLVYACGRGFWRELVGITRYTSVGCCFLILGLHFQFNVKNRTWLFQEILQMKQ